MTNSRKEENENAFYRDYYQIVMLSVLTAFFLILIGAGFVYYQLLNRPLPDFSAISETGSKIAIQSHEEPNLLPDTLIKWASKAAVAAYTFDFVNYNKQFLLARPYFTAAGWNDYLNSVARLIQTITQNQLFVNGVVSGPPVISNQGELGAVFAWRVQIPFLVTYQSAESTSQRNFTVLVTIIKIPTSENPKGIGIDRFVMIGA